MENEILGKLIPATILLILGLIEALGGLYFEDKRTKNDFTIELISLVTLPTLIQPAIFLFVLCTMEVIFTSLANYFVDILKINWFSDCHKFVATENQTIVTNGGYPSKLAQISLSFYIIISWNCRHSSTKLRLL